MYQQFYKLSSNPFRLAPEPDFCFSHSGYRCAKEYLEFALAQGEGFVMVTGRPGTGKTMLVETFLKGLNDSQVAARRIAVSNYNAADLLRAIAYAYGIDAAGLDKGTLRHRIHQFFVQQEQIGRRVLLIIDEAQTLSHAALEELRILADLQTRSRLMLQLFLVGQEALQELMRTPDMEQFQQRVIANYKLIPLNLKDTRDYIEHRLQQAGWRGDPEFSSAAVMSIYQLSNGLPRHINKICNRLLLLGFGKGSHVIDEKDVQEISAEMHEENLAPLAIDRPQYDADNVTKMSDVRDGQLSASDLSIRAANPEVCTVALPEGARVAIQNGETYIPRHNTPPVSNDEPGVLPGTRLDTTADEGVVPADSAAESQQIGGAANDAGPGSTETGSAVAGSVWLKGLGVAMTLLLVVMAVATMPSLPGHERIRAMLPFSDQLPQWTRGLAVLPGRTESAQIDIEVEAPVDEANLVRVTAVGSEAVPGESDGVTDTTVVSIDPHAGDDQLAEGVIERGEDPFVRARPAHILPVDEGPGVTVAGSDGIHPGKVANLLEQARLALDDYRLVTPEGDNAHEYLVAALQQDPGNETALAGLQQIIEIYTVLADRAIGGGEYARAGRYLDRGLAVQPDDPGLLALRESLDNHSSQPATASVTRETAIAPGRPAQGTGTLTVQSPLMKRQAADRRPVGNGAAGEGI